MAESQKWIPLESNPTVFNKWAKAAGLIPSDGRLPEFQDVYGLEDELLAMVGTPTMAVILLFPDTSSVQAKRNEEDAQIIKDGQPKLDPTIFWIKQTIKNACGTMALIHALANTGVAFGPMSPLSKFIEQCEDKTPLERAKLLETTPLFTKVHADLASTGESHVPRGEELNTDLHFVCFVQAPEAEFREIAELGGEETENAAAAAAENPENTKSSGMRLVELDGSRRGPVDRGECKDFLKDVAKLVKDKYIGESSSMEFSMIAFAGPPL